MKSPSRVWGGNPIVTHRSPHREAIQKSKNQGAKRNLIPLTRFKPPRSGDGSLRDEVPQAGLRAAALSFPPVTPTKKQKSGSEAKPDSD